MIWKYKRNFNTGWMPDMLKEVLKMATESFDMALEIKTEEGAANFLRAIEEADARGPLVTEDHSEEFRRGEELLKRGLIL